MGVYSTNRHQVSGINLDDIVANESYTGNIGIEKMIIENHENDMAIFEALLKNDIQEVAGLKEGTILESELASINEASVKGIWEAIKKAILSFFAKIKSILESFEKKFLDVVDAGNKKLLDSVKGKIEKKDLSKFTYKWRDDSNFTDLDLEVVDNKVNSVFDEVAAAESMEAGNEIIAKYNDGKLVNELLAASIKATGEITAKTFGETFEKLCLGEEKEVTGLDSARLNGIIKDLGEFIPAEKRYLAKAKSDVNKSVKDRLRLIDKTAKDLKKNAENEGEASAAAKIAEGYRLAVNSWQTASLTIIGAQMRVIKLKTAQDRSVITKALMYNPKKAEAVNASALFDAIDECTMAELDELALCY